MGKPFSWSYSRLKNFETCPKRHYHIDVVKDVKEDESEHLSWGNEVHRHLARRIGKGTPLPKGYEQFEPWAARLTANSQGKVLVEQKLAITEQFEPCDFFDRRAWFRTVADVIVLNCDVGLMIDWKTGKILDDPVQLALGAAVAFAHHPAIQAIRTEFVWLKEGLDVTTREDFTRKQMVEIWRGLWPRIDALRRAYEETNFPANPGRLCRRWCPVTQCPHHGE